MSALLLKHPTKCLAVTATLCYLSACGGGGTVDIMGEDDATFVGSVSLEKIFQIDPLLRSVISPPPAAIHSSSALAYNLMAIGYPKAE